MNKTMDSLTAVAQHTDQQTKVAVLGTLAEFHSKPIPYDLAALVQLVSSIQPDLLCLDMTKEQWQARDYGGLPPEYQQALLPLAYQSDIVVVPIAGERPPSEPSARGWRGRSLSMLRGWLARVQSGAPGPDAINYGWRHDLANLLYMAAMYLGGSECRQAWKTHTDHLIKAASATIRRDPGNRVLIVVNVRHCHHIRPALRKEPGVSVVRHDQL